MLEPSVGGNDVTVMVGGTELVTTPSPYHAALELLKLCTVAQLNDLALVQTTCGNRHQTRWIGLVGLVTSYVHHWVRNPDPPNDPTGFPAFPIRRMVWDGFHRSEYPRTNLSHVCG